MKIKYLNCRGKKKLFSFYRHDYRTWEDEDNNHYMIDDGFEDYHRYSHPDMNTKDISSFIKESHISEVIEEIREQFTWGRNYTKDGKQLDKTEWLLLKDISNDHLKSLLEYWNSRKDTLQYNIFKEEQNYRELNNIKVKDYA